MARFLRKVTTRTLTLGTPETIQMPRNNPIREIVLRIAGSVTISGGLTSGTPKDSNPLQVISRITVRRNGSDTLISIPGDRLHRLVHILNGARPAITGLSNGDAQTNTAVSGIIRIPFENVAGIRPFDTLLDASKAQTLDLILETQAVSNIINGGDRTVAVGSTSFSVEVLSNEEVLSVAALKQNPVFGDIHISQVWQDDFTAANSKYQIKPINVGNRYKGLLLVIEDTDENGLLTSELVNNIKLASGQEVFIDAPGKALREEVKDRFGIDTLPEGYYYVDLMPDGRLNSTLDVRDGTGRNTLEMELDLSAPGTTGTVYLFALEYLPPIILKPQTA